MAFKEMKIKGAWVHTPDRHFDDRGFFEEKFKLSEIKSVLGREFEVRQVNQSVSARGVIRGVHFSTSAAGQAKYIFCARGKIWDVVVDLREGSETYGLWDAVEISSENGKSVLISEGLGHAFLSLEDGSVSSYLCTAEFDPANEKTINPLSAKLRIDFASHTIDNFVLSDRDKNAPDF